MKSINGVFAILACLLLAPVTARAQQFQIKTQTLKNGMKIMVEEDR